MSTSSLARRDVDSGGAAETAVQTLREHQALVRARLRHARKNGAGRHAPYPDWAGVNEDLLVQLFGCIAGMVDGRAVVTRAGRVCRSWRVSALEVLLRDTAVSRPKRFLAPVREPAATSTQITHAGCVIRDDEALSAEEGEAISSKEQAALPGGEEPLPKRRAVDVDGGLTQGRAGAAHRASAGSPDSRRRVGGGHRAVGRPADVSAGGDGGVGMDASEQEYPDPTPALAERAEASDDDGEGAVEQQVAGLPLAGHPGGAGPAPSWTLHRIAGMFSFLSGRRRTGSGGGAQPGDDSM